MGETDVMLTLDRRCATPAAGDPPRLLLPFETRQRSRFRAVLSDGTQVAVILERGQILRGGEHLCGEDGAPVRVEAAAEPVSEAHCADPLLLARASYHLGNRHVPLQLGPGWLRYLHDHVLDDMVRGLGLNVTFGNAPFEPEAGAYAASPHPAYTHAHDHGHQHGHRHAP
jgi:urease accessory protein